VSPSQLTFLPYLLLFHNDGRVLKNVRISAGPIFRVPMAARGLGLGDFDNNGAPVLLRNQAAKGNHWLGVKLVGTQANIDAIGARVTWKAGTPEAQQAQVGRREAFFPAMTLAWSLALACTPQ
jgi:hypothetical protein